MIRIAQRPDRHLLLSIYEQSRQIYQVRVDAFGPLPEDHKGVLPHNNETLLKALQFLKPLAEDYSKDKITKDELKDTSKPSAKAKSKNGKQGTAKAGFKRPASAAHGLEDCPTVKRRPSGPKESPSIDKDDDDIGKRSSSPSSDAEDEQEEDENNEATAEVMDEVIDEYPTAEPDDFPFIPMTMAEILDVDWNWV